MPIRDNKDEIEQSIVREVMDDFEQRRSLRKGLESQWTLNCNFVNGAQYCDIGITGELVDDTKDFLWRERQVYNHITPLIETRLAKLGRVRPKMSVRPSSNDDNDIRAAKLSSKILDCTCERIGLDETITIATNWSEITGNVFYKIVWDSTLGRKSSKDKDGKPIYEGDVRIDVCSPYEIYPDNLGIETIENCMSIIHAKRMHRDDIFDLWGVRVNACDHDNVAAAPVYLSSNSADSDSDYCTVVERYTRPTAAREQGELVIVTGDRLLYLGELPFCVGDDSKRGLPFVQQKALWVSGSFYGASIVERAIPVQRAYNAVKNRKHELMNRIATGVLAVEDGSVDVDDLIEDGLSPGKIVEYRQGSAPPRMLDIGRVPSEFNSEEDRLHSEFITVSGVSEIMRNSSLPTSVSSGTAIALLIEQDDTRLSLTAQFIRVATREIAKMVMRLYKQFALTTRLDRVAGDNGDVELMSWQSSDLGCDDVVFDSINELSTTPASKQTMLFDMLRAGLLQDENGKLSDSTRYKLLDALGYGGWERARNVDSLHIKRAERENIRAQSQRLEVEDIDDHALHIDIHTEYLLSKVFASNGTDKTVKTKIMEHIKLHRQAQLLQSEQARAELLSNSQESSSR